MTIKFLLLITCQLGRGFSGIDQPVKYGVEPDGSHWLEVHEPLSRNRARSLNPTEKSPCMMTSALRFTQGQAE